jgi:UDP-glucose 4-epimerase
MKWWASTASTAMTCWTPPRSARTGIPTVSLRPGWVWDPGMYERIEARWRDSPASEWEPFWEYGQFVDVRDVAAAVELALTADLAGHHRLLLCAPDIAATEPSLTMAARLAPSVPVKNPALFENDPWHALIDCSAAARVLGWHPRHTWASRGKLLPRLKSRAGIFGVYL